ncbi:eukaryotic translation initiation factor eIF2A-domain-containing protein [Entophlyctis helioformis]|nr:eukaryotic translation initiation factor eIF2A-domain-containing protein [Entophlyctis helioformis]KAI8924454.1 eukaryotic translation initiation factor eIF2A-domain-containing protein [Entophlyctis helioformis]
MAESSTVPVLAYRSNTGLSILAGPPSNAPVALPDLGTAEVRNFLFSPLGKYLAVVFADRLFILSVSATSASVVREFPLQALEIEFSPKDTYISTYVRYVKSEDGNKPPHKNVSVWNIATGEEATAFTEKNPSNWQVHLNVTWTEDETFCGRRVGDEIQFHDAKNFSKGVSQRLKSDDRIASFSVSPGKRPIVAVFFPEKNGRPAAVRLYDVTSLGKPLSEKSFYRADSVSFHWNSLGTNVLVFTHTDVDATGQSYYGETNLFYLSITGNYDCKVNLDKSGPIHDVCWSPNAKEFVVVYGTMPAKATLFDHRANAMYEFGSAARNQVKFNPNGRLLFIGGFGNLAGEMDVWDRKTFKKVATIHASNSSSCDWAPDGKHIMTSTLYRRLKVDNGIKFWHYTGVLVNKVDVKEMHQTSWKADPRELWPERGALSPAPAGIEQPQAVAKPLGKYRPPGARNGPEARNFYDRDAIDNGTATLTPRPAVPGAARTGVPGAATKADGGNAAKGRKKSAGKGGAAAVEAVAEPAPAPSVQSGIIAGSALETEKKIKALNKKLRQIMDLKEKQAAGQVLELTQIQKIDSEGKVREEIAQLEKSL